MAACWQCGTPAWRYKPPLHSPGSMCHCQRGGGEEPRSSPQGSAALCSSMRSRLLRPRLRPSTSVVSLPAGSRPHCMPHLCHVPCQVTTLCFCLIHSTRCCCTPWTAACSRRTLHMSGPWASSLWPGAPAASSWPLGAMTERWVTNRGKGPHLSHLNRQKPPWSSPQVRLLNHVTWKMTTEFGHPAAISNPKTVSPERAPSRGAQEPLPHCPSAAAESAVSPSQCLSLHTADGTSGHRSAGPTPLGSCLSGFGFWRQVELHSSVTSNSLCSPAIFLPPLPSAGSQACAPLPTCLSYHPTH